MRVIKFRAWDKDFLRMLHDATPLNNCLYWGNGASFDSNLNRYEVMQFTGILDRNGKEIYEGDILQRRGCRNAGFVKWSFFNWTNSVKTPKGQRDYHLQLHELDEKTQTRLEDYTVIGNIYENPELTK